MGAINSVVQTKEFFRVRSLTGSRQYRHRRSGQTLVEYGLIIAVIAVVAIGVLVTLGQQTKGFFSVVTSDVAHAAGS
jgi:Flp pilus assembly pilin Flp